MEIVDAQIHEPQPTRPVDEGLGKSPVGTCSATRATLRPEFGEGKFERLYAAAEKHNLPLFFSTHGHADALESVAREQPGLTMIVDHLGVSQSPVSPPRDEPWDKLPGLLSLAKLQ